MSSSFFGINVAQQGLFTARTNLDITNHNISNAETPGYSRQYGVQQALRPLTNGHRGMVGTGSEITTVDQYRDEYLDYKYWNTNKELGMYDIKYEALSQMELVFNEPTDVGFTSYFDDVFKNLQTLAKDPSDNATRTNFANSLDSFTSYLNDISSQLRSLQDEMNFGVKNSVDQINSISTQLGTINQQIVNLEITGEKANDLRDERMRLIDDLSKIATVDVNFNVDINDTETCVITINGQQLVNGSTTQLLEVRAKDYLSNPEENVDMYDVYWESGKRLYTESESLSGELKGYLEVRDGNNKDNFTGTLTGITSSTEFSLNNVSRHDIPESGGISVNGVKLEYDSYIYDEATNSMTFTLDASTPLPTPNPTVGSDISIGTPVSFKGIPYYMQQLNDFSRTIARKFNEVHESGDTNSGIPLITYDGYDGSTPLDTSIVSSYDQLTVNDIVFNPDILDNIDLLETKFNATDGEGANDLVMALIDLRHDDNMFEKGEPDSFIQSMISEMGIDVKQVSSFRTGQEQLSSLITNQRLSISDVDLDEEATNLIKFQQAYNMAAKILSVFDEIYEVTINGLG